MNFELTRPEAARVYTAILKALNIGDDPTGARERALEARAFQWTHDTPEDYAAAHETAERLCELILDHGGEPACFTVDLRNVVQVLGGDVIDSTVCINALALLGCEPQRADPRIYSNGINAPLVTLTPESAA